MSTIARGDDLIASYSSKGPTLLDHVVKPDLVAPGNSIVAALAPNAGIKNLYPANVVPLSYYRNTGSGNLSTTYFRLSGTSMAAPMVSGAAALVLQRQPGLSPDQVKARLMKTATKAFPASTFYTDSATGQTYEITYDLFTVGAGYVDVWAALNSNDVQRDPRCRQASPTMKRCRKLLSSLNPVPSGIAPSSGEPTRFGETTRSLTEPP